MHKYKYKHIFIQQLQWKREFMIYEHSTSLKSIIEFLLMMIFFQLLVEYIYHIVLK